MLIDIRKMHLRVLVFFTFSLLFIFLLSCRNDRIEFPFSEDEMVENKMYGMLMEYAIYDSSKIDFVKLIICDSIRKNQNLVFGKIIAEIKNKSYYMFDCYNYEPYKSDYFGVIYIEIDNSDSIYLYSPNLKYSINDIAIIIDKIAKHNKGSLSETIRYRKVNNQYIPNFYFIVLNDSMDCEHGFVENFIRINRRINKLMDIYSENKFMNESLLIRPYIEIRKRR